MLRESIRLSGALGTRCGGAPLYLELQKAVLPRSNSRSFENEAHSIGDQEASLQFKQR